MAGSSITFVEHIEGPVKKIVATCTADDTDGTFPATALPAFSGHLLGMGSNPGAVAPQANYDVTLVDGDGVDRLQGVGANRHTSNSEYAAAVLSGTEIHPPVATSDTLTLTLVNNNVNDAVTVLTFYFEGR